LSEYHPTTFRAQTVTLIILFDEHIAFLHSKDASSDALHALGMEGKAAKLSVTGPIR
jgi:hypothetical protein